MHIYLRNTVDGEPKELSVKLSRDLAGWYAKVNSALGTKEDAKALNHHLDILQAQVYGAKKNLLDAGGVAVALAIVNIMNGAERRNRNLLAPPFLKVID
jgi:hypothetical protein